MQIDRLRLWNFRQHEDTTLELGSGLTGIVGPNGAGKSTLLEAIGFALYGTAAARGTRDSIRRRGAKPRAPVRVELEFTLGPHRYRLVRGLTQAELYLDADPAPLANSLGAVTGKVSQLLGMTREEFFNTYFTSQKELAVMAAMTAPERARFLSRVLGYERLRLVQDRLKISRAALKSRLETLQQSLVETAELDAEEDRAAEHREAAERNRLAGVGVLEAAAAEVALLEPEWRAMQELRERVVSLAGEQKLAEHRVADTRERFTSLDRRLAEALAARAQLVSLVEQLAPMTELQREREALDRQAEAHAARRGFLAQADELRRSLASLEDRITQLPDSGTVEAAAAGAREAREVHRQATTTAEERRTAWVRDAQDAQTKRAALRDQYRELKAQRQQIQEAGPEGVCPTCGRALGEDLDGVTSLLDRQLQEVEFNGNFYNQRVEQLENEPEDLREADRARRQAERAAREAEVEARRLQDLARKRPDLERERAEARDRLGELEQRLAVAAESYDEERHQEVRRLIERLEPVALQAERQRALADQAEKLVAEAETVEKELSVAEEQARSLAVCLEDLGFTEEAFTAAQARVEDARRRWHDADKAVARARAELEAADIALAAVGRRREERARIEEQISVARRKLLLDQELDRAFTDLRTDLNASLRPELSDLASTFVRDLTNDRYSELELDEDYMAVLLEDGQPKPVVSGGEEDVANLALRLAISQMIADRAGQPLSLLVLDEIFGSLDDERRTSVLELLRSLADRFPQVVLITHIESVREGFDRIVRVTVDSDSGVARVRDEDLPEDPGAAA